MQNRREFIRNVACGLAYAGISSWSFPAIGKERSVKLTVLHTNDIHSRLDPFPMNDPKFPGMGGAARRASIIAGIRKSEKNVLLFDAGDIFQGTPYFNLYGGEPEMKVMSKMGYDAATIGNHDFDNGIDGLAGQFSFMNFPFINSNYDFKNTPLENKILPYRIFKKDGLKIGVFGLGIQLHGLVDSRLFGETKYLDPLTVAGQMSSLLKHDHKCNLVICLSHLGYRYENKKISDVAIAKQSSNIDLIIGGHTHTFLDTPATNMNTEGKEVLIAQAGWAGIKLGRIDFYFDEAGVKRKSVSSTVKITENTIAT